MIENIVGNLISDIIWLILGVIITIGFFLFKNVPKYRRLTRFFGITAHHPRLRVYFSRLNIPCGGSVDAQETPRSYSGAAIPEYEFGIIQPVLQPFHRLIPRHIPQIVLKRLESWRLFKRPEILFEVSPLREQDLEFDNLILAGSQGYNVATGYYSTRGSSYLTLEFDTDHPGVVIRRGRNAGERIPVQDDLAILVKIMDTEHGNTVFIGAGMDVNGTRGAIEYLMNNWEGLKNTYGDQEFGICLRFPTILQDAQGFRKPVELRRLPR